MFVDGLGELIVDALTANRSLSAIPSASAILDTSNYTFHAITYGKNADGFKKHGHVILSPSGANNGVIKVLSYQPVSVSSYHSSSVASALSHVYNLLPEPPSPINTRLETKSTLPNYSSGVPDSGHCLNPGMSPTLSSFSHLIGCFPRPTVGLQYWVVSSAENPAASILYSGTLFSNYNYSSVGTNYIMDSSGFLTFASSSTSSHVTLYNAYNPNYGVLRVPLSDFPNKIRIWWYLGPGDAGSLLLFGGVYHIGLWALDLKEMLRSGINPPFNFNALNNTRRYKLVAKKTFNRDLLYLNDYSGSGGFNHSFEYYTNAASPLWGGLTFNWDINFV